MSDAQKLRVDGAGLRLPEEFADHREGIVIRTPRSTIDHKPGTTVGPRHGMVAPKDFDDAEELHNARNPELAPDNVRLKRYGEEPQTFPVEVDR